jgi:hypothetical protein
MNKTIRFCFYPLADTPSPLPPSPPPPLPRVPLNAAPQDPLDAAPQDLGTPHLSFPGRRPSLEVLRVDPPPLPCTDSRPSVEVPWTPRPPLAPILPNTTKTPEELPHQGVLEQSSSRWSRAMPNTLVPNRT